MFKYFPHTPEDIQQMLDVCGVNSLDDLYADVPEEVKLKNGYNLPKAKSEMEIRRYFDTLAKEDKTLTCFAGAGCYDHYIPAVVPALCSRSEFLTSYTPYQAEISQGTLHYIFEFQTMMSCLTGMPVSNASLYDGATATAEAMMMACANSKKSNRVVVSDTLDPKIIDVMRTYAHWHGTELVVVASKNGVSDKEALVAAMEDGCAGLLVQQPNYYGIVEDYSGLAEACHQHKALMMMSCNPADLALLKTPAEWGADVVVGEAQSLGLPMAWGGPYLGYMCVTEKLMRKMPGRIVGQTTDGEGHRTFILTLQAREQHIRRRRATSNICSNESLMALWVTIYLSLLGKQGLCEVQQRGVDGAHYLHDQLIATGHFADAFPGTQFFNEFCLHYDGDLKALQQRWNDHGLLGGVALDDHTVMIAVTEKRTKEEMDELVKLANK